MTTPTSWHSAHIYYYEPDKDALILDAIRPLCHQLRPVVERAYVIRHWRQGPHLRLHVRTDPQTWATTVQPQLEHTIGDYLRGPLTPWYPDLYGVSVDDMVNEFAEKHASQPAT